jgi:exopolysaccharide biosynthesis polyprenyl glycosylphosphotransferase
MKKADLIFLAVLVPVDYITVVLAGLVVYYLRFSALETLRPVIYEIPLQQYLKLILLVGFVWLFSFAISGLYSEVRPRFSREVGKIFIGCSLATMFVILFIFFSRELFSSRFIILAGWFISIIFVSLGRFFVHLIKLMTFRQRRGLEPILILGKDGVHEDFVQFLENNPTLGYRVLDRVSSVDEIFKKWKERARDVSQIIQVDPNISQEEILKLVDFCNEHQIIFKYVANLFGARSSNIRIESLAGVPVVEIRRTALDGWGRIVKRLFDIVVSLILLILCLPLFIVVSIIIVLDSPGFPFVALERVGVRGKIFRLYKFRSMIKGADKMKKDLLRFSERQGPLFKMKNDPRITRVGKFIRQTSIDELPQLINVLKGEMSLVGPRPHEPGEVSLYERYQKQLLTIKPGMTGLAQISGRSNLPFEEEARLDIYYIENWSFLRDVEIILKTIPVVLSRKTAA